MLGNEESAQRVARSLLMYKPCQAINTYGPAMWHQGCQNAVQVWSESALSELRLVLCHHLWVEIRYLRRTISRMEKKADEIQPAVTPYHLSTLAILANARSSVPDTYSIG